MPKAQPATEPIEHEEPETREAQVEELAPNLEEGFDPSLTEKPPPKAKPAPKAEPKKSREAEELRQLREDNARLRRESEEARSRLDSRGRGREKEEEPEEEDYGVDTRDLLGESAKADELDDEDFIEALSTKGPAAVEKAMAIRGFVRKEDVVKIAATIAGRMAKRSQAAFANDAAIMRDYPDLANEESELFVETGKEYRILIAQDPLLKKSPATLLAAAKVAKAKLDAAKASRGTRESDEDDDYPDFRERDAAEERKRRIRAQQGERSNGRSSFEGDEDAASIGPQARQVIAAFSRYGVTEESYRQQRRRRDA